MTRRKKNPGIPSQNSTLQQSLERYSRILPAEDYKQLLEELAKPLHTAFRLNRLKNSLDKLNKLIPRYGWELETIPFCSQGYRMLQAETPPSQTIEHRMGDFYIQDAASMLPAELFNFFETERPLILDLAASPGGKTTHLADRIRDRGTIIANDSSRERLAALRIVLQTWSTSSSAITCFPGERFGSWYPDTFDAVLLDAPCSMDGLRSTEAHPLRPITSNERTALARRQANLLRSALQAVKPGGEVVYSTCTLAPEEDEGVLNRVLKEFPGAIEIMDIHTVLNRPAPALMRDETTVFEPGVRNAARLWPHLFNTAGFFAAKLQKRAAIPNIDNQPPSRSLSQTGFSPLQVRTAKTLFQWMMDDYGFNLREWLEAMNLELWGVENKILALPSQFLQHFPGLPVRYLGLGVAEKHEGGFDPTHDFCSRVSEGFQRGFGILTDEEFQAWIKGQDVPARATDQMLNGKIILLKDICGGFIGRGRVQRGQIRNLLPRRAIL